MRTRQSWLAVFAWVALACPAFAQSKGADLSGVVRDSSGAVVPRAALKIGRASCRERVYDDV